MMVIVIILGSEIDKNIIPSDSNSKLWTWILGYGLIAEYQNTLDGILSTLEWFQSTLDRKQSRLDSIHSIAGKHILKNRILCSELSYFLLNSILAKREYFQFATLTLDNRSLSKLSTQSYSNTKDLVLELNLEFFLPATTPKLSFMLRIQFYLII